MEKNNKLKKRLWIWIPVSLVTIIVLSIISIVIVSYYYTNHKWKPLRQLRNCYDTYELMMEDERYFQEKYPQLEQFIFDINIEGTKKYEYIIDGIDYCKTLHSKEYCPHLRNRMIYICGTLEELYEEKEGQYQVKYKYKTDSLYEDFEWIKTRSAGKYNSTTDGWDIEEFTLKDKEGNEIIAVEASYVSKERKQIILDYLVEQINQIK